MVFDEVSSYCAAENLECYVVPLEPSLMVLFPKKGGAATRYLHHQLNKIKLKFEGQQGKGGNLNISMILKFMSTMLVLLLVFS